MFACAAPWTDASFWSTIHVLDERAKKREPRKKRKKRKKKRKRMMKWSRCLRANI